MIPNDRGAGFLAFLVVTMFISIIAVGLRFWSRALGSSDRGAKYWWDDWTALLSLVSRASGTACTLAEVSYQAVQIIMISMLIYMITLGFGRRGSSIPMGLELKQMRILWGAHFTYNLTLIFAKTSVLLFYARVLGTRIKLFKYALWFTHFLVIGWFIAMGLLNTFLCNPIEKQWRPSVPGHCHAITVLWLSSTISDVVIDFILLLLPLPMLWRLQMKCSRKILIMAVFACGYW